MLYPAGATYLPGGCRLLSTGNREHRRDRRLAGRGGVRRAEVVVLRSSVKRRTPSRSSGRVGMGRRIELQVDDDQAAQPDDGRTADRPDTTSGRCEAASRRPTKVTPSPSSGRKSSSRRIKAFSRSEQDAIIDFGNGCKRSSKLTTASQAEQRPRHLDVARSHRTKKITATPWPSLAIPPSHVHRGAARQTATYLFAEQPNASRPAVYLACPSR